MDIMTFKMPRYHEIPKVGLYLGQTAKYINADSLEYLSLENLEKIAPNSSCGFCTACFTGNYAVKVEHLMS